jgi:hypothetical protein
MAKRARFFLVLGATLVVLGVLSAPWPLRSDSPSFFQRPLRTSGSAALAATGAYFLWRRHALDPANWLRTMIRKRPRALAAILCVGLLAACIALMECAFYCLNALQHHSKTVRGYPIVMDDVVGYKPPPNLAETAQLEVDGQRIYSTPYTTDEYSRRRTPAPTESARRFAMFFGCSFTFGEGVGQNETLPARVAVHRPDLHCYNYGFRGYGPQQTLARTTAGGLRREIAEDRGVAVYTLMDDHVKRAIGSMQVCAWWGQRMPYYHFTNAGTLARDGFFSDGRPLLWGLYSLLGRSQAVKYFRLDVPLKLTEPDYELTAAMLIASRDAFQKEFPDSKFVVVFFPWSRHGRKIQPSLERNGVRCLDYSELLGPAEERSKYIIPFDSHPNAAAYEAVAGRLAADLGP